MKKLIDDTLKTHGKWSMKRVSGFAAFWLAVTYEFGIALLKIWFPDLMSKEYVFDGFLTWAGVVIIGSVVDKKIANKRPISDEAN